MKFDSPRRKCLLSPVGAPCRTECMNILAKDFYCSVIYFATQGANVNPMSLTSSILQDITV